MRKEANRTPTMSREVGNASNCVTLYLYVWRKHLTDEGLKSAQFDDEEFVFGC